MGAASSVQLEEKYRAGSSMALRDPYAPPVDGAALTPVEASEVPGGAESVGSTRTLGGSCSVVHAVVEVASQRLMAGPAVAEVPAEGTLAQASDPLAAGGKAPTPQGVPAETTAACAA
jgi:hypothetical protein